MKRVLILIPMLLAIVMVLSAPSPAGARKPRPCNDRKAAGEAFELAIKDIKSGKYPLEFTGFDSLADVEKAELGEEFRIFELNAKKIYADAAAPYDPKAHVKNWCLWVYLIRVEGKAKTLLHIFFDLNGTREFRIGTSPFTYNGNQTAKFAKELDGLLTAWPRSAGYQCRVVMDSENTMGLATGEIRAHVGLRSIIELSQNGKVLGFFPLTYSKARFGERIETTIADSFAADDLLDPNRFLSDMRTVAKQIDELYEKQLKKEKQLQMK